MPTASITVVNEIHEERYSHSTPVGVTVLGLGPMGQAMVRALLAAGHPVTVWNRTASRADALVAEGAQQAETPAEALAHNDLVLLSLTDYQAMDDILSPVAAALPGRVLINLSSDTPDRTRAAADWARSHGARLLTGGVMVPAPMVGTDASYVYYSGPADIVDIHRAPLAVLGGIRYLGKDPGLAQLMYQANLDVFLTTLSALMHATALVGGAGIPAVDFVPEAVGLVAGIPAMLEAGEPGALGKGIDAGKHPGELSTVTMMGATADHIVATSEAAGIDTDLARAVQAHYHRAIADGHGKDNWTRIIDGIGKPCA